MSLESRHDKLKIYTINLRASTKITKQGTNRPRKKIKLNVRKHSIQRKYKNNLKGNKEQTGYIDTIK